MDERITNPPKISSPEEENPFPVKDSWLEEYMLANRTAPQVFVAITPFLTLAVLRDPPVDWTTLYCSRLSSKQFKTLEEGMNRSHKHEGVQASPSEDRIFSLWTDGRDRVCDSISMIIQRLGELKTDPSIREINEFFKESKNKSIINEIIDILLAIRKAFNEPEPKKWLESYIHQLKNKQAIVTDPSKAHPDYFKYLIKVELEKQGIDLNGTVAKPVLETIMINMNPKRNHDGE